ncbi:MAG: hypothetical protein WCG04_01035 [Alphaproteobacteria bacterium]
MKNLNILNDMALEQVVGGHDGTGCEIITFTSSKNVNFAPGHGKDGKEMPKQAALGKALEVSAVLKLVTTTFEIESCQVYR